VKWAYILGSTDASFGVPYLYPCLYLCFLAYIRDLIKIHITDM